MVLFTQKKAIVDAPSAARGLSVVTLPDLRWGRRDIKTVQLLYPSMAKMEARARGADDAWLVEDGYVTEGTSNNAWIVTADGAVVTRDLSHSILHGITRKAVLAFAREAGLAVEERRFTVEEAKGGRGGLHNLGLVPRDGRRAHRRQARRQRRRRSGRPAVARNLSRRKPGRRHLNTASLLGGAEAASRKAGARQPSETNFAAAAI